MIVNLRKAITGLNRRWMSVLQYPFPQVHVNVPEDLCENGGKDKLKWVKLIKPNELQTIKEINQ